MLAIMELFLDALSLGNDIRRSNREDREERRRGGRRMTFAMWLLFFLAAFVMVALF